MTDETPESESANGSETAADAVANDAEAAVDPAPTRIRRRTAPAPVRKKDLAAGDAAPVVDAAASETVEDELSEEESEAVGSARASRAPVKKEERTRRRSETKREASDPHTASNPAEFVQQSVHELKQVVWPTRQELWSYFLAVLVFVVFFIAFIGLLDMLFGWGLLQLFGGAR